MRVQNCPSPNLVYGEVTVLATLVRLKSKQAKYDLSLRNESKSEIIDIKTTGKPGAALTAQLKSRSNRQE